MLNHKSFALAQARPVNASFAQKICRAVGTLQRGQGAIYKDFPKQREIDLWTWNVNGVSALIQKGIFREFMRANNPTVLCLNETKTTVERLNSEFIYTEVPASYTQFWNCSTARKGYSGTAILSKVEPLCVEYDFGATHVDEGRSITVEFK